MIRTIADKRTAKRFLDDPVAFIAHFDREPWDYQAELLGKVTERDAGGIFKKRIAVISQPRQDGKTTLSAWLGLWRFICDPTAGDIVSVALDREGARALMFDARRIIGNNPKLMSLLAEDRLTKAWITLKDGRQWMIRSADSSMSRGLRPSTVLFDELGWSRDDGDLFQVLTAAQGAQENPLILVTSTVSPIQAGALWDLFQAADVGDRHIRLLYSQENQSPLVSEKYLNEQRALLPPGVFAREHMNQWGSGSDVFCTNDDYERAVAEPPLRSHSTSWLYADLGWRHDETAIAISQKTDKVDIIHLEGHKPPKGGLSLDRLKERLLELVAEFNVKAVQIESPQGVLMAEQLILQGVRTEVIHPTQKSNSDRWGALWRYLQDGGIRIPKDKLLRRQLLSLTIKSGLTGWRVIDVPSIHQDRAVAVAGACFMAKGEPVHLTDEMMGALKDGDKWAEVMAGGGEHISDFKVRDGRSRWDV